jgi:hypothetical protein
MKARGGSGIVEKNKSKRKFDKSIKRKNVEYSIIGYKVVVAFVATLALGSRPMQGLARARAKGEAQKCERV